MIASCAMRCPRTASRRPARPKPSSRGCRSRATIPCILSPSMPRATIMSISPPPPIPARPKIGCPTSLGISPAPNSRPAAASGATTPTRRGRNSLLPSVTPPASATREGIAVDSTGRHLCDPAGTGPAARKLASLYTQEQGAELPAEELMRVEAGRRLWLARVLFRRRSAEAGAGAGIWRRRRQDGRAFARRRSAGRFLPRPLGAQRPDAL